MSDEPFPAGQISPAEQRAALAEVQLLAAEAEVEVLRARQEHLTATLLASQREREATQYWLDQHRRSLSWRITEPLRAAKRAAIRYRGA